MSFLKKFVDTVTESLGITSNKIQEIIKENNQYLDAEEEVSKESKEGIAALKSYAETETPSLEDAVVTLAATFELIEEARSEKVQKLRDDFIAPLESLVEELSFLEKEKKEAASALKDVEKSEKKLDKLKSKPAEKLKPGQMDEAEAVLKAAEETLKKEEADVKEQTETFNKKKFEIMKNILNKIVEIEKAYHEKILAELGTVKQKADNIKVEEASQIVEEVEEE